MESRHSKDIQFLYQKINFLLLRNVSATMCDVVKCKHGDQHDSSSKRIQQFRMSPRIIISKCPKLYLDI